MKLLSRLSRKASRLVSILAMQNLYGSSLGWEKLAKSPKIASGSVFGDTKQSLPWFTYPAIAQLMRMSLHGQTLLEYGCGSSTAFFVEQGCRVQSIEDNSDWANLVNQQIMGGGQVCVKSVDLNYVQTAEQLAMINPSIIIVDGVKRKECCSEIKTYLESFPESRNLWMVILDNSDWLGASYSILDSCDNLVAFDYYGHGPYNTYSWCTTLFLRPDLFNLRKVMQERGTAKPMRNGLVDNFSESI